MTMFKVGDIIEVTHHDTDYSPLAQVGMIGVLEESFLDWDVTTNAEILHFGVSFEKLYERYGLYFLKQGHFRLYNPVPEGDDWI